MHSRHMRCRQRQPLSMVSAGPRRDGRMDGRTCGHLGLRGGAPGAQSEAGSDGLRRRAKPGRGAAPSGPRGRAPRRLPCEPSARESGAQGDPERRRRRRRRLLLREGTRREARPERQTAPSAPRQGRPFLRDPPPELPRLGRRPPPLKGAASDIPHPRKAPRRADATPESHWDILFLTLHQFLGPSRRGRTLSPAPRSSEDPGSGNTRPARRRGEDWRRPTDPSSPARAGDGAAARRCPELPARGPRWCLRAGPRGRGGAHEPGHPQHDGHPLRAVGAPRRDGGGAAQAAVPAPQSAQGAPGSAPQRHPTQFGEAAGVRRGGWQQADSRAHRGGGPHVSGFKARTVCDAGPGELDGDPGQ